MKELMYNLEENFCASLNQWNKYLDSFSETQDATKLKMVELLKNLKILTFEVEFKKFENDLGLLFGRTVQKILVDYNGNKFALTTHDSTYLSEDWVVDGEFTSHINHRYYSFEDVFKLTNEEADMLRWLIGKSEIETKIRQYNYMWKHNQSIMKLQKDKVEILTNEVSRRKYLASLENKRNLLEKQIFAIDILSTPLHLGFTFIYANAKKASTRVKAANIARMPKKGTEDKLERIDEELQMIRTIESIQEGRI